MVFAAGAGGSRAAAPPDRLPPTKPTIDGEAQARELRPTFTFAARDRRTPAARIRFTCSLDGAAMRPCARIYRPLQDQTFGKHVLRVRAFDMAGNASPVSVRTFDIIGFWDAGGEIKLAPTHANPGPDRYGNTTWFYLYSPGPEHDPASYRQLPEFVVIGDAGWQVWRTSFIPWPLTGYHYGYLTMHPGVGPTFGANAILGWRSPVAATVRLDVNMKAHETHCPGRADGIDWSIDQGARTLLSGTLAPPDTARTTVTTSVAAGEMIYLITSGRLDWGCDGTQTTLTIQTVPTA